MKTAAVLLAVVVAALVMAYTAVAIPNPAPGAPALTATPTVTATPTLPPFEATMSVVPDELVVFLGEELQVTVDMEVSEGCQFPLLELELKQDGPDGPIFDYIEPPTSKVLPGISLPMTFRLAAVKTGEITFVGAAFGESKCGDGGWIWTWENGKSAVVTVEDPPASSHLPLVLWQWPMTTPTAPQSR